GKIVERGDGLSLTFRPSAAGKFTIFEYALSEFGVRSLPSRVVMTVHPKYVPPPLTAAEVELAEMRKFGGGDRKVAKNADQPASPEEQERQREQEKYDGNREPSNVEGTSSMVYYTNPFYNQ